MGAESNILACLAPPFLFCSLFVYHIFFSHRKGHIIYTVCGAVFGFAIVEIMSFAVGI